MWARPRSAALALLLLTAACEVAERSEAPAPPPPARAGGADRFADLATGDTISGMRVDSAAIVADPVDGFGWMGTVDFSGGAELTGEVRPHMEFPDLAEVCFFADDSSAAHLPRFPNDVRRAWFCFANHDEAIGLLGPAGDSGRARVVIDRYLYIYQHSDVYNRARLVRATKLP